MHKLILFTAIVALTVTATEFVVPAAAKGKAVATGPKMKIKGVVTRRDADSFTVRSRSSNTTKTKNDTVKGSIRNVR